MMFQHYLIVLWCKGDSGGGGVGMVNLCSRVHHACRGGVGDVGDPY